MKNCYKMEFQIKKILNSENFELFIPRDDNMNKKVFGQQFIFLAHSEGRNWKKISGDRIV